MSWIWGCMGVSIETASAFRGSNSRCRFALEGVPALIEGSIKTALKIFMWAATILGKRKAVIGDFMGSAALSFIRV